METFALLQNQLAFFLLVFTRITGIFTSAPVYGSRNIPVYVKAGLSLLMAYTLLPMVFSPRAAIPESFLAFILAVAGEFLLGLIFGFTCQLIMYAIQMAGHLLDVQIGFGIVNVFDPQFGQQIPLLGNFKYILALMVFLSTNGHHVVLSGLFSSFQLIPVTGVSFQATLPQFMVDIISGAFAIGFKLSLPVLVALVLTDVALGILARTMPQMNIFIVGVPGKIIVGIFALMAALPFYIAFLEVGFNGMYRDIYRLLEVLH